MKDNPKALAAAGKPGVSAVPPTFEFGVGKVMAVGADKYGRFNWQVDPVKATTYWDAIRRHMLAWAQGEDIDPESGVHHLYHVAASCAVVTDAHAHNTLENDLRMAESLSQPEPTFEGEQLELDL